MTIPSTAPAAQSNVSPAANDVPAASQGSNNGSLNDIFQNIDMSANSGTVQDTPVEPEPAPVIPDSPVTGDDPNKPPEPVAPVVPPVEAAPSWVKELVTGLQAQSAEANRPVNDFFQVLKLQQEQNVQRQAKEAELQKFQAYQNQVKAMRDLQRPRAPNWNEATPEAVGVYAQQLAQFEARCAREDAQMEMQGYLKQVEAKIESQQRAQQEREMAAESQRVSGFIDQAVERFKVDPTTPFMANQAGQDLFLAEWWSANERAGKLLDPSTVMVDFKRKLAAINGAAQTTQKRAEQTTIDAQRKAEQTGRGAPNQVKPGGTPQGPAAKSSGDFDKPWWETSAFRSDN